LQVDAPGDGLRGFSVAELSAGVILCTARIWRRQQRIKGKINRPMVVVLGKIFSLPWGAADAVWTSGGAASF
jgi:hypothetical protein